MWHLSFPEHMQPASVGEADDFTFWCSKSRTKSWFISRNWPAWSLFFFRLQHWQNMKPGVCLNTGWSLLMDSATCRWSLFSEERGFPHVERRPPRCVVVSLLSEVTKCLSSVISLTGKWYKAPQALWHISDVRGRIDAFASAITVLFLTANQSESTTSCPCHMGMLWNGHTGASASCF